MNESNMDIITLNNIDKLHPKIRQEARSIYDEICTRLSGDATVRFNHTLRTFAEQDALFAQGRTTAGKIVTKAKAGLSYHNYGLAIDIVLLVKKKDGNNAERWDVKTDFDGDNIADWIECVQVFKEHGFDWGGDWKFLDLPHFQKTFGFSVRELLRLYNNKKVDKNNYVLI